MTEPDKEFARREVRHAVAKGRIVKPDTCSECGDVCASKDLDGHHHNGYSHAAVLDVIWLCKSCHGLVHGGAWLITDDQRRVGARTRMERYTPEERSAMSLSRGTAEERSAWVRKGVVKVNAARTPEQRSDLARKAAMTGTPEERRARSMKGVAARLAKKERKHP